MLSTLKTRIVTCAKIFVVLLGTIALDASADATSGHWVCDYLFGGSHYPQDLNLTQNGTNFNGTVSHSNGGSVFSNVAGTFNGSQIEFLDTYTGQNYQATSKGTLNGDEITGTWKDSFNQAGSFTCTRKGSVSSTPTATPTSTPPGTKRKTAISIFCNRTGVGLGIAECSVSIADAGAPPRSLPSGTISFAATGGFFPSSGSCAIQQTQFSPGIGACNIQFQVPLNFPIAVPFPIDATYAGDSVFEGSTTSHALISAGCIGDQEHPCSGAVALTFANLPQILKNAFSTVLGCGKVSKTSAATVDGHELSAGLGIDKLVEGCAGIIKIDSKVSEILAEMTAQQLQELSSDISKSSASSDKLLNALKELGKRSLPDLQIIEGDAAKLESTLVKLMNNIAPARVTSSHSVARTSRRRSTLLSFGSQTIAVRNNTQKTIKVRLTRTAARLITALKKAGQRDIPLNLSTSGRRSGTKIKFKAKQTLAVGLN